MRIGVMLRAYDRPGGIGIYSRNIIKHLLKLDHMNHYLLIYNNSDHLGTYSDLDNVDEVYVPPANQLLWDQWHVPRELKRWDADLVFNTKFSVPLFTKNKRIMVLHGASWFMHPELYGKLDIIYVKRMMPIYCKVADFLISNSDLTTRDYKKILGVPSDKIQTVNLAAGEEFRKIEDAVQLEQVRKHYNLPDRFILTVTSYDPRKNFSTLIKAFQLCREHEDVQLVVIGKDCHKYNDDYVPKESGLSEFIHYPGWVDQQDLPAIYNLAKIFAFPSVYEEFGIPVVEAISCGCPVASSNTGAIPDLLGDAAMLCDPFDYKKLSENILQIITSDETARHYMEAGIERSKMFSWDIAALQTLDIFERVCPEIET